MTLMAISLAGARSPEPALASMPLVSGAPILSVPGPQTVNERVPISFNVTATDPDGQTVELTALNPPSGAGFADHHNNTGTFNWTPASFQAGSYLVSFRADDTFGGIDTKSVAIEVLDSNGAPVLDPIGNRFVDQGSTSIIMATGTDPDGDVLSYTPTGLPSFGTFSDYGDGTASLVFSPTASDPPVDYPMTLTLSDGVLTDSQSFTVTVVGTAVQHAPALAPIGNQTAAEGASRNVTISASDEDGDALSWSVTLPGFASLNPGVSGPGSALATLAMAPGYCAAGTYPAHVAVSDGLQSTGESFTIQVTNVNRAPVWGGPYSASLLEGAATDVAVSTSDPDQACGAPPAVLTVVGSNAGSALTANLTDTGNGSGVLHLSAAANGAGSYIVTLRASDPMGASPETQVAVTVGDVNRAPTASAGGPYLGVTGVAISFSGSGSDPDGDVLSFSWSFGDGAQANGAAPSHTFANTGVYVVVLTVRDGTLSDPDSTTATVSPTYAARVWSDPRTIRLHTGKPQETVLLEPVAGSFDLAMLDFATLSLCAPPGTGAVECIQPIPGKTSANRDRDHNGVRELAMEFAKDDLRRLFSSLTQPTTVYLEVTSNLTVGGTLRAGLTMEVIPEKGRVLHRVSPNPLNPDAVISLRTDQPGSLRLRLYDLNGRLVRTLVDASSWPAGDRDVMFNGRDSQGRRLASGRYFLRAETSVQADTAPITILK